MEGTAFVLNVTFLGVTVVDEGLMPGDVSMLNRGLIWFDDGLLKSENDCAACGWASLSFFSLASTTN